ncbi:deoxyhypusine synthase family protein [Candidatus Harpocratesius sp.]
MKELPEGLMTRPVEQMDVPASQDIVKMVDSWDNMGFNAKRLAKACKIYEEMIRNKECVKFFALSGAMVPAGMQKIIYDFLDLGFVDVLVTTGANLTHDIVESLGDHHLQGFLSESPQTNESLHEEALNRIYDVFMPNQVYENMEDWLKTFKIDPKSSVKEALWTIGEHLPEGSISLLKKCAEKKIPVFCPAITDSGLGMQLSFLYPGLNLNHFSDLQDCINLAWDSAVPGVFIVGGGVPKNFIFQAMQFSPNSAKFVVQLTTDVQVSAGGLSSASLNEAISWGKVNAHGDTSQVHIDATIALPIILSYLKQKKKQNLI